MMPPEPTLGPLAPEDRRPAAGGPAHVDALPPGARLAEFEVVRLLGVGGFGMVYEAYDHQLQRPVAIKEYMPAALVGRADDHSLTMRSAADQQSFALGLKSFITEARLLARFDHPSLVKVHRFWEANHTAYMVMPLYVGITLKAARAQMRRPPSEAWLRQVLAALLGALQTLHGANTVHRDVSPDNIFLQDVGPPVLLDLGAARRAIEHQTQQHTAVLKVNYAPIEQYANAAGMLQGPWTDLYALAAVVHGLLCNDAPQPSTFRLLEDHLPPIQRVAAVLTDEFGQHYSPPFLDAIHQALTIRPAQRPQSVTEFTTLMALAPPGDMHRFDWRAGMGESWEVVRGSGPAVAPEDATTVDQKTLRVGPPPPASEPPPLASSPTPAVAPAKAVDPEPERAGISPVLQDAWRYAWLPVVAALTFVGITWWRGATPVPPGPPATVQSPAPAAPADEPVGLGLGSNETAVVPGTASAPVAPAVGAPAAVVPGSPVPAAVVPSAGRRPPAAPEVPATARPAPVPAPATPVAPAASAPPPVEPPVRREAEPAVSAGLCADTNIFTRPMCLHNECQKPAYARSRTCIDYRGRSQDFAPPRPDLAR